MGFIEIRNININPYKEYERDQQNRLAKSLILYVDGQTDGLMIRWMEDGQGMVGGWRMNVGQMEDECRIDGG